MLPPALGRTQLARFRGSSNTALDNFEQQPSLSSSQALQSSHQGLSGASLTMASSPSEGGIWARGLTEFDLWRLKEHIVDLAGMLFLVTMFFALDKAPPRKPFIATTALPDYSMPFRENTVPPSSVLFFAYLFPVFVIVGFKLFVKGTWKDVYRTTVTLYFCVGLVGTLTNCIKIMIGRPRPNFVARCWPEGEHEYTFTNNYGGIPACTSSAAIEAEHLKSFPSGHSSLTSAGLGFLTFCLLSFTKAFSGTCHPWRVFVSILPAIGAIMVAATRVMDYWHHPTDVLAGLTIGFSLSFMMHQHLFPWFSHPESDTLRCHIAPASGSDTSKSGRCGNKLYEDLEVEMGLLTQESV